ncbi:hypothetical protein HDU90_004148 [Geranomyces variabilis]|nr:hypothetical protein HDU90_004148 [Geranomyces variabilis]
MPGMAKKTSTTTTTTTFTKTTMAVATATATPAIKAEPKVTAAAASAQPTGLSIPTVQKAVQALMAHNKQWAKTHASNDLLAQQDPSVQHVDLIITTKTMPDSNKSQLRPTPIPLCHPLYAGADILLITKDPQREYKDLLEAKGIKGISKVMDYSHLRAKFKTYEARRQLAASYDLFLADERVLALLPKVLGKTFFQKKLLPVPIDMTASDLELKIRRVLKGTFLRRTHGVCTSVRIGSTAMGSEAIIQNILKATPTLFKHIPGGWNNVRSVQIKTSKSAALPLLVTLPAPPGEQQDQMVSSFGGEADEDDEVDADAGKVEPDSDDSDAEESATKTKKKITSSATAVHGIVADTVSEVLSTLAAATAEEAGDKKPSKSSIRRKRLLAARKSEKYRLQTRERQVVARAAKSSAEPSSAEQSSTEEAPKSADETPVAGEKKKAAAKPAADSVKTPAKTPMKTRAASTKKAVDAAAAAAPATPTPAAPATPAAASAGRKSAAPAVAVETPASSAPATPTPAAAAEKKTPVKKTPAKTPAAKTPTGTPMKTRSASVKKSAKK